MEKYVYDENNGLWYELQRLLHSLFDCTGGRRKAHWHLGQRHLRYIKAARKALYSELLLSGKLNSYLVDINAQAEKQMLLLTKQMAVREGVTEQLKAQDQMLWVQRLNNIRDREMEIVNSNLIYA